jgi:hypothetical protein
VRSRTAWAARTQGVGGLGGPLLTNLGQLHLGLAHRLAGPGDIGLPGAARPDEVGLAALQGQQPALGREPLLVKLVHPVEFVGDQLVRLVDRGHLGLKTGGAALQLLQPLVQHPDLAGVDAAVGPEQGVLAGDQGGHPGIGAPGQQFRREYHLRQVGQLRVQPRLLGDQAVVFIGEDVDLGPGLGVVHDEQRLTLGHLVALMDEDLTHHAAVQMLDGLAVVLHRDRPRHRNSAGHREHRGPDEETDHEDQHGDQAGDDGAVHMLALFGRDRVVDAAQRA